MSALAHRLCLPALALLVVLTGCTTCQSRISRSFNSPHDSFAFTNELKWAYTWDSSGKMHPHKSEPEPTYIHHCFPMARAAREFFYHARFDPSASKLSEREYRQLVNKVVARDSRCPSPPENQIVIPGFDDLHQFSAAFPHLLQTGCGTVRDSYFQRGNWRMVFPFTRGGQTKRAQKLAEKIKSGLLPLVHVTDFPTHTINHAILLFAVEESPEGFHFSAYDPNNPSRPAKLSFNFANKSFEFEQNNYFAGGKVNIYEVYRNLVY